MINFSSLNTWKLFISICYPFVFLVLMNFLQHHFESNNKLKSFFFHKEQIVYSNLLIKSCATFRCLSNVHYTLDWMLITKLIETLLQTRDLSFCTWKVSNLSKTPQDTHPYPCLDLKNRFFWYFNVYHWFYLNYIKAGKK